MNKEFLSEAVGGIRTQYIEEAARYEVPAEKKIRFQKKKNFTRRAVAACVLLLVVGAVAVQIIYSYMQSLVPLSKDSYGVTVRYEKKNLDKDKMMSLGCYSADLTAEKKFQNADAILQGRITEIRNISIHLKSRRDPLFRAIVSVQIEKSYRGDVAPGTVIQFLTPFGIGEGQMTSSVTLAVGGMRVGMRGVFLLDVCDDEDYDGTENSRLMLRDLADYRIWDDLDIFLERNGNLYFEKWLYTTIPDADSIEEIEDYIAEMAEKTRKP